MTEVPERRMRHISRFYDITNKKEYKINEVSKWLIPNINKVLAYIDSRKDVVKRYNYTSSLIYLLKLIDKNNNTNENKTMIKYLSDKNDTLKKNLKTENKKKDHDNKANIDDLYQSMKEDKYKQRLANKRRWYKENKKKISKYNRKYYDKNIKVET